MLRRDWLTLALALLVVGWIILNRPVPPKPVLGLVPAPRSRLSWPGYRDPVRRDPRPSKKSVDSIFRLMEEHRERYP